MPAPFTLEVPFSFGGLDYASDPIRANPNKARSLMNVRCLASGALTDREGSKVRMANNIGGAFGTFLYEKTDPTSFITTKERLIVSDRLYKETVYDILISYAGAGSAVVENLYDAVNGWTFKLYVGPTEVMDLALGNGFDEASPVDISDLAAAINATADFTVTVSSLALALPAALIPTIPPTIFAIGSPQTFTTTVSARLEVNHPTGATLPFANTTTNKNAENFENVSSVQTAGSIYFGSKYDNQCKYDGNDCYRSGAPTTTVVSAISSGAGVSPTAGTRKYIATVVQIDQNELETEGNESTEVSVTTAGTFAINVTLNNVLANSGFNTDCAVVNGAGQVSVSTITVDNGSGGNHTMKVGQNAYFYDAISASYVVKRITGVAATTISISGGPVTVADNAVISNNLRLRLKRTEASGSIFYDVIDLPNNSFTTTQVYSDSTADTALGNQYLSPASLGLDHGLPPKGAYLAMFNGRPVTCGLADAPNSYAWASPENPEYYPENFLDYVSGESNAPITGAKASDKYLWINQGQESFMVTGDLFSGQYTTSKKGDRVGCQAHASIVDTDMGIIWMGDGGFYYSRDGAVPERLSGDIEPVFSNSAKTQTRKLLFKKSVAVWDSKNKLYICFIPGESIDAANNKYANGYSRIFVYDARQDQEGQPRSQWYEWDSWNMAGGAAYDETTESLFWTERHFSAFEGDVVYKTWERLFTNTIYDMIEHNVPVLWNWKQNWFHAGQPKVNKKFPSAAFFSMDTEITANCTIRITTERNFIEGVAHTDITQTFGVGGASDGFGFGAWGFFPWGSPRNSNVKPRNMKMGGSEAIRWCFSGGAIYSKMVLSNNQAMISSPFKMDMKEIMGNG